MSLSSNKKENKTRATDFNVLHKVDEAKVHHLCDEISVEKIEESCLYPLNTSEGIASYEETKQKIEIMHKNLLLCGRMTEFKYLDMDAAI